MPWERRFFKNNKQKVWVELDEAGEFVKDDKGLVPMRYKVEDTERTYTAHPRSIGAPVDASAAPVEATPAPKAEPKKTSAELSEVMRTSSACVISTSVPDMLVNEPPPDEGSIEVYTDGACQGNPGPCSLGVVIRYGPHYKEMSQYLGVGTNNIGELTAILVALESFNRRDLPVRVHTDSSYSIGAITKGWKIKANKDLILSLRKLATSFDDLGFVKVKGHAGIPLNERADQLAVGAIERQRDLES